MVEKDNFHLFACIKGTSETKTDIYCYIFWLRAEAFDETRGRLAIESYEKGKVEINLNDGQLPQLC